MVLSNLVSVWGWGYFLAQKKLTMTFYVKANKFSNFTYSRQVTVITNCYFAKYLSHSFPPISPSSNSTHQPFGDWMFKHRSITCDWSNQTFDQTFCDVFYRAMCPVIYRKLLAVQCGMKHYWRSTLFCPPCVGKLHVYEVRSKGLIRLPRAVYSRSEA